MKKGESGIGTLIIFIAMLLVAAIAAGVLIQTTNSLQNKALTTGQQAQSQISNHIDVLSVVGTNGSINNSFDEITMTMRLSAGSDTINLRDLVTTLDTSKSSQSYSFTEYTITYLQNGTGHMADFLVMGDVAKLRIVSSSRIGQNEKVKISLIPKIGIPTNIDTVASDIITNYNVYLYP